MRKVKTQTPKIQRTLYLKSFVNDIKTNPEEYRRWGDCSEDEIASMVKGREATAMDYFARYPFWKVRRACLKVLAVSFRNLKYLDWAKSTITSLVQDHDTLTALKVMEEYAEALKVATQPDTTWYGNKDVPSYWKFRTDNPWQAFVDMVLLAAEIGANPDLSEMHTDMIKLICNCMDPVRMPGCYGHEQLKPIHELFAAALDKIKGDYYDFHWERAELILGIIAKAGDKSYKQQIKEIVVAHQQENAKPPRIRTFYGVKVLAVLQHVLRTLSQRPKQPSA